MRARDVAIRCHYAPPLTLLVWAFCLGTFMKLGAMGKWLLVQPAPTRITAAVGLTLLLGALFAADLYSMTKDVE
ncbi:MAG: hypothetical protein ABIJ96_10255 [Elusimicrobiota bacterium]